MVSDIRADSPDNGSFTINDSEITTLLIQVGFVEAIVPDRQSFDTFSDACRFVFRNNKESGILLLNGLPVELDYPTDIPYIIEPLVDVVEQLINRTEDKQTTMKLVLNTPNFTSEWTVHITENGMLTISTHWDSVPGAYQDALNKLGVLRITTTHFVAEWAILILQVKTAIDRAEITLIGKDVALLQRLTALNEQLIGIVGKIYRKQIK